MIKKKFSLDVEDQNWFSVAAEFALAPTLKGSSKYVSALCRLQQVRVLITQDCMAFGPLFVSRAVSIAAIVDRCVSNHVSTVLTVLCVR